MGFEFKLWLVSLIIASCVPSFHSPYGPRNDDDYNLACVYGLFPMHVEQNITNT